MAPLKNVSDNMVAGAVAGALARLVSAPFDMLKIRFQLQYGSSTSDISQVKYRNIFQATRTVIAEEGFFSLWKGNLSATYLWVTYSMVQFGVYGFMKQWAEKLEATALRYIDPPGAVKGSGKGKGRNEDPFVSVTNNPQSSSKVMPRLLHTFVIFLAGASAGMFATSMTYPFDLMRTQFAIQGKQKTYPSINSFVISTYKNRGLSAFYAGLGPSLLGICPYIGLNFAFYELAKSSFNADAQGSTGNSAQSGQGRSLWSTLKHGVAGGLAGTASKVVVYPLDTVKKRMQAQVLQNTATVLSKGIESTLKTSLPNGSLRKYNGVLHCMATMMKEEGVMSLYKGISPTLFKSFVSTAITFSTYDHIFALLQQRRAEGGIKWG